MASGRDSGAKTSSVEPISRLRTRYQALTQRNDAVVKSFITDLNGLSSNTTPSELLSVLDPAEQAITSTANGLWCLRLVAPPKLATSLRTVAADDVVVDQSLAYLASGFQSRGFNRGGWYVAFRQAAATANAAAAQLQHELRLH